MQNQQSKAVANAVKQSRQNDVFRDDIQQAIIDDAIVICARKSLSLTSVPAVLDVAARALMTCRGKTPVSHTTINKVRSVDAEAAKVLARINAAVERINTSAGPKVGCRRGRTAITKRMLRLAKMTLDQKTAF